MLFHVGGKPIGSPVPGSWGIKATRRGGKEKEKKKGKREEKEKKGKKRGRERERGQISSKIECN